jgi:hypothetical protein
VLGACLAPEEQRPAFDRPPLQSHRRRRRPRWSADQSTPGTSTGQTSVYSSARNLKYVAEDANAYNTGRLSLYTASTRAISSTTAATITGLSAPVNSLATYRVHATIPYTSSVAAGTPVFAFSSPTASPTSLTAVFYRDHDHAVARHHRDRHDDRPHPDQQQQPAVRDRRDRHVQRHGHVRASGQGGHERRQLHIAAGALLELFPVA